METTHRQTERGSEGELMNGNEIERTLEEAADDSEEPWPAA
jgi:hypothetical protein